jgi:hypothetical protein
MKSISKIWSKITTFSLSAVALSQVRIPDLYGPPISPSAKLTIPMQTLYGPGPQPIYGTMPVSLGDFILRILSFLLWIVVPLAIIIALIVGIVVYFRRKKAKAFQKDALKSDNETDTNNSNIQLVYGVPRNKDDSGK